VTTVSVLHSAPVVVPVTAEPIYDGAVAIAGDRIADVGPAAELEQRYADARVRRWPGVLAPGLVNAHAHLQYTDFADMATTGLPFVPWIRQVTERRLSFTSEMWVESTRRGLHQLLQTGTTCVADIVTSPEVLAPTVRSGLAGVSYVELVGVSSSGWDDARARLVAALEGAPAGRTLGVSPHAPYSLGTSVLTGAAGVARERGLRLHPHAAETRDECEFVRSGTGLFGEMARTFGLTLELLDAGGCDASPVSFLDQMGLLGADVHVAHGVHVDADGRALLRDRRTPVALCTRSNRILAAGEAPVAAYLAEGNPICVGTDSLASSPSLDLLEELRALRELALAQGAPYAGLSRRLVEAATVGGAAAMGLSDVGRLEVGARADLAAFDVPVDGDPYEALVESGAGRCVATVLGGRIVHRRAAVDQP
jgi:cytosine/adenosine deaminase-related metal-dependent hydrolase